jgi:hypothetical protein
MTYTQFATILIYSYLSYSEFKKSLQTVFHVVHRVDLELYSTLLDQLSTLIDQKPSPNILYRRGSFSHSFPIVSITLQPRWRRSRFV